MSTIMAVAAHPADAIFSMGAAVAQHIHSGGSGAIVCLSLGEKGSPTIPPAEYGEMQRKATVGAAAILGAKVEFLPYPDAEIPAGDRISLEVCDVIRKYRPRIVVTHWHGSWHKDHQNTFLVVRDAVLYAELSAIKRELPPHPRAYTLFAENWEDALSYQPNVYLDISPVFESWVKACALFPMWRGESGLIRYHDHYQSLAAMRGSLAGCKHAVTLMKDPSERLPAVTSLDY